MKSTSRKWRVQIARGRATYYLFSRNVETRVDFDESIDGRVGVHERFCTAADCDDDGDDCERGDESQTKPLVSGFGLACTLRRKAALVDEIEKGDEKE